MLLFGMYVLVMIYNMDFSNGFQYSYFRDLSRVLDEIEEIQDIQDRGTFDQMSCGWAPPHPGMYTRKRRFVDGGEEGSPLIEDNNPLFNGEASMYNIENSLFGDSLLDRMAAGKKAIEEETDVIDETIGRVLNGTPATIQQIPWQVSIWGYDDFLGHFMICGGSILSNRWVLTAAHCLHNFEQRYKNVVVLPGVGKPPKDLFEARDKTVPVLKAHCHRIYQDDYSYDYDICLAELKWDITYDETKVPICIPPLGAEYPDGMKVQVSGWGAVTKDMLQYPEQLQVAEIDIIATSTCNQPDWLNYRVTSQMICAGLKSGQKDACARDSGGPLFYFNEGTKTWTLVGIVSWGFGCGEVKTPGVYTKVSRFSDWIWQTIENNSVGDTQADGLVSSDPDLATQIPNNSGRVVSPISWLLIAVLLALLLTNV